MDSLPAAATGSHRSTAGRPRRARNRLVGIAAATIVAAGSGIAAITLTSTANAATVGAGSYTEVRPNPATNQLPQGCGDISTNPRQFLTERAPKGAVPTNDWWSSLVWKRDTFANKCAFSEPLHAHPVSYGTFANGLGLSYNFQNLAAAPKDVVGEYHYAYTEQVRVGVAGLNAPNVKVDGWSDWTVSPYWSDGSRSLKATIGHGLPFSYYEVTGGAPTITAPGSLEVWQNSGSRLGFRSNGTDFVAYAPNGGSWSVNGTTATANLAGKNYFSVAALPTTTGTSVADRTSLANTFGTYAHNHVSGTRISYDYNQNSSNVSTTYAFTTQAKEGSGNGTVAALYPHHWRSLTGSTPLAQQYTSARGKMKVVTGTQFQTTMRFTGVLPEVPAVGDSSGADLQKITDLLQAELNNPMNVDPTKKDTYWEGKGLGRAARIAEIADQLNITSVRDKALDVMRSTLNNWLTASPNETERLFYYDKNWGTLIGYPASFGSDADLNDHHFHYGYFIAAAATLAKFDPAWATDSRYGGMIDVLIRDANNYDRNDTRFPYLRDFDIYAGHDWASGPAGFGSGNNQESSSEGMNFANALIQWGQATGKTAVRDAGVWILTTQAAAIQEYWFDRTGENLPTNWHDYAAIVWGSGGAYSTWFGAKHEYIYGINMLPITGGHFYLGEYPEHVRKTYDDFVRLNGGPAKEWFDIFWQYQALGDPDAALAAVRANPNYEIEAGESKAHTFHWVRNLAALGNVDRTVTANHPLARVFSKNGAKTYVASNITKNALTVTFTDGKTVNVPAGKTVASGAQNWSGGNASGGGNVSQSPTPSVSPSVSPSPSKSTSPSPSVSPSPSKSASPSPSKSASPSPSKSPSPSPSNPGGQAWAPYVFYSAGTVVTYQGAQYRCWQSHTSLPGWEPSIVPALWQKI